MGVKATMGLVADRLLKPTPMFLTIPPYLTSLVAVALLLVLPVALPVP